MSKDGDVVYRVGLTLLRYARLVILALILVLLATLVLGWSGADIVAASFEARLLGFGVGVVCIAVSGLFWYWFDRRRQKRREE